uniref:Uncharacterized protein n=1 Tax=Rhizophora mucronata TaxID=61149 RepID=A0A2P2PR87_RHIMU
MFGKSLDKLILDCLVFSHQSPRAG